MKVPRIPFALILRTLTLTAVVFLGATGLQAQGVATTGRQARSSPLAKTDLPLPKVRFEDIAEQAGLRFDHVLGEPQTKAYILETTGSGAAIFDFDGDGLYDIFLVNGTKWKYTEGESKHTSKLFRNRGGLRFEDVTAQAGFTRNGWGQGVCVGDYDNDGFDDLFVTYYGSDVLYRNRGGGKFENVTTAAGLPTEGTRWGTGCAFLDFDRDGDLDLAVANYVNLDLEKTPTPGETKFCMYKGMSVLCGPRGLPGGKNVLYENLGEGKFADISEKSGFAKPSERYGLGVLTADFDNDGWTDVYVASDSTPSILYRNNRDGTFTDIGLLSGTAFNEDGQEQAGMGVSSADFNHDGLLDIVKTNFADDTPTLYRNEGDGFFTDITFRAGLGVHNHFLGWGVGFLDVNNDGWKDILTVNSHVYPSIDEIKTNSPYRQQRTLYWNIRNGAFIDISDAAGPGILARSAARGAAFGDLDNDGALEVVINNLDAAPNLLVNRGERGHWLLVKTVGTESNRNGIGARLRLTADDLKQVEEVRSGGSYISHNDSRVHFGLGESSGVDQIEVRWPSGRVEVFGPFEANREVTLTEGQGRSSNPRLHEATKSVP